MQKISFNPRLFFFIALLPLVFSFTLQCRAETTENLQAQIENLMLQVRELQLQLAQANSINQEKTFIFQKDLGIGDFGEGAKHLQQILNRHPITQVAEFGPGSPGNETEYFGILTRKAVKKFQELNFQEILAPASLAEGTGFVGPLTRGVLNKKTEAAIQEDDEKNTENTESTKSNNKDTVSVRIKKIVPPSGADGVEVELIGSGFAKSNTIYTGFSVLHGVSSSDKTSLKFILTSTVPDEAKPHIPNLPTSIYVKNKNGTSNGVLFTLITD